MPTHMLLSTLLISRIFFADDLSAMREYSSRVDTNKILDEVRKFKSDLHEWGRANCIVFDATKESLHVISRTHATPGSFKLLGVEFERTLLVDSAVHALIQECSWESVAHLSVPLGKAPGRFG